MAHNLEDDIIDLTGSMPCTLVNHCALSNVIIDLDTTPESLDDSSLNSDISRSSIKLQSSKHNGNSQCPVKTSKKKSDILNTKSNSFGECPICWDALGRNPLASTKCGHVYCMKCIERSLQIEKRCPTCRTTLRGKTAYHPLFLYTK